MEGWREQAGVGVGGKRALGEVRLKQYCLLRLSRAPHTQPQSSPGKLGASDILAALCEAGMEGFNLLDHFLQTPAQSSRLNKQGFSTAQKLASFSASPIC